MAGLIWVFAEPRQICGATQGKRGRTVCELPPDHVVGRNTTPAVEDWHTGRSPSGRWYSWPREVTE